MRNSLPGCTLHIMKFLWKLEQLLVFFLRLLCGETHHTVYIQHTYIDSLLLRRMKWHHHSVKEHSLFGYVSARTACLGSFLFPVTICCPPALLWSVYSSTTAERGARKTLCSHSLWLKNDRLLLHVRLKNES